MSEKKVMINTYIPQALKDRLNEYSEKTGISITRIVADAIKKELDEKETKK